MSEPTTKSCVVVHSGAEGSYAGKQGFSYFAGISAETANSRGICMHLLGVPPGGRAKAHLHENHETTLYVISGEAVTWYGEGLRESVMLLPELDQAVP